MAHMCGCMFLFAIGTNWEIQKTQSNHPQKGLVDHLAYTTSFGFFNEIPYVVKIDGLPIPKGSKQ